LGREQGEIGRGKGASGLTTPGRLGHQKASQKSKTRFLIFDF
jgi:hypothetical protein